MTQFWGNEELGSLSRAAKSGHGEAAENASGQAQRHLARTLATEGLNEGPSANAQRAGHMMLASAKQQQANRVSEIGTNVGKAETVQAQTVEETSAMQKVSAHEGEALETSLRRNIQA